MTEPMQAAAINTEGKLELATVDRPEPGPTEVLIRVEAAGINPADWKSLEASPMGPAAPEGTIPGWDIAGTVVVLGPGVNRFAVGDRVFGMPKFPAPANAYAQYATARSREIAQIPDEVSTLHAGAIPLAGLTAWQAIVDTAQVSPGDRVLIHGASGGVGHLAVQVAKARGAEVWGTASAANHDLLRELGVDHPIDYRNERFEDLASELDVVLGLGGGPDVADRSVKVLRSGGHFVAIGTQPPSPEAAEAAGVRSSLVVVEPDYASLEKLGELMASGALRVVIAEQRPLGEVDLLHDAGRAGGTPGKLVAVPDHTN